MSLAQVKLSNKNKLKALIGPHAGFRFSGPNAAWAYKNVDSQSYDRVFILGPSHKVYLDFIGTTGCHEWETPLGNLSVDQQIVEALTKAEGVEFQRINKKYEENEHSLEMHLPYIRKVFESRQGDSDIKIIPLMVGQLNEKDYELYAKALVHYFDDDRSLFVVSSDFCHWG